MEELLICPRCGMSSFTIVKNLDVICDECGNKNTTQGLIDYVEGRKVQA